MSNLLAIEATSSLCSVAVKKGDKVCFREQQGQHSHTQFLLPFIDELLQEQQMDVAQLDAIAFAAGPGSFTGIRLAASIAKSLAYAAHKPVIVVSSLAAIAQAFQRITGRKELCLIVTDARMGELYIAEYDFDKSGTAVAVKPERMIKIAELESTEYSAAVVAGDAFALLSGVSWLAAKEQFPLMATAHDVLLLAERKLVAGEIETAFSVQAIYLRDKTSWKTTEQQQQEKLNKS